MPWGAAFLAIAEADCRAATRQIYCGSALSNDDPAVNCVADAAGAIFHEGKLLERPIDITPTTSADEQNTAGSEVA